MEITLVQSFATKGLVGVAEKLYSMKLAVTVVGLYFSLRCLAELPRHPVDLTVNVRGTVAIQEYLTAAMAMTKPALNALSSHKRYACVERKR